MFITTPYRLAQTHPIMRRELPPLPLYVDTVNGTATGAGTANDRMNNLAAAVALCAGLPDWEILVRAPASAPVRQQLDVETSANLTIRSTGTEPWHIVGSEPIAGSWRQAGRVWFRAFAATIVGTVVVTTYTETIGDREFHLKLRQNTETPTTPGPGEYGYEDGVLFVRMPDDSDPGNHLFEAAKRNTCITTTGTGLLTLQNVDARYVIVSPILNGTTGKPVGSGRLLIEDSFIGYSGAAGNGVTGTGQNVETTCNRVTVHRAGNDGFNLHATAGLSPAMVLNGCDGSYNGDTAGSSAQGASNHEETRLVINGGKFNYNVSGGMVVINDAVCDMHGDTSHGPIEMVGNMRLGNTAGTIAGQAAAAWLDNSTGTVTGRVLVTLNQGTGVRVARAGAVAGLASIESYANALPDAIAR